MAEFGEFYVFLSRTSLTPWVEFFKQRITRIIQIMNLRNLLNLRETRCGLGLTFKIKPGFSCEIERESLTLPPGINYLQNL